MKTRILGNSGLEISEISFGAMSLKQDAADQTKLIHKAIDAGINLFDSADLYEKGWNETFLGEALKDHRKEILIATKVGNKWRADGSGWDWNPTKEYILEAIELSLKRLQTDYIDLYQLHGGTIEDPIDEIIEAFEFLKDQGKIRAYGISSIRPNVIREFVSKSNISSVMLQYSLLDRRPEESILELLESNGIGVLTRGSLAKGLLVDKPAKAYLNYSEYEVSDLQNLLKQQGDALKLSLAYPLSNHAVSSLVLGIRTEGQLKLNVSAYNNLPSETDFRWLSEAIETNIYEMHR